VNKLGACGGICTTGSHAPADCNGFKIVGQGGRSVGLDTGLSDISRIAKNMVRHDTSLEGALRTLDLTDEYRAFVRSHLHRLRPLKLVVDASNGMAGRWMPTIFDGIPDLDIAYLNSEHEGTFAHDPDPQVDDHLEQLRREVPGQGADLGICFDGDAGRLAVVDENAEIVPSDIVMALLARHLLSRAPGSTIVYDLRSSRVVVEEVKAAGGVPRRERVGQPFIKKAMAESKAVFGGELSGRFYFRDNFCCDSGFLAVVHLLNVLSTEARPLGELVGSLRRYANSGQHFFENAEPDPTVRRLAGLYSQQRVDFLDGITVQQQDWWFNVRRSITSATPTLGLIVEAATPEMMQQKFDEVAEQLGTPKAAPTAP
jgi:phosphomannomutase